MSGDYKVRYLTIKNDYETGCVTDTMSDSGSLDAQLERLDTANNHRTTTTASGSSGSSSSGSSSSGNTAPAVTTIAYDNTKDINDAFAPIAQYYANLQSIKERLQDLLDETSKEISSGQGVLMNEERYSNSTNPERAIKAREATNGFIPELKTQTIPILISIGAAMLAFSIVLSFQMMGVYGQFTLSPAYSQAYATFQATVASITNNTSIVGGFAGVSLLIALYFAYLFYSSQPRD